MLTSVTLLLASGCSRGLARIDSRVNSLMTQASGDLGPDAFPPDRFDPSAVPEDQRRDPVTSRPTDTRPATVNPAAAALPFNPLGEAEDVLQRLRSYDQPSEDALQLDLPMALGLATRSSREFKFAQEQYVLGALRLLVQRHLWGPRFFDDVTAEVAGTGDAGLFDTSLQLVNEFRVTQRLPYGGEVSARALASATEDLHQRVAGENVQSAELILEANVPLLRGAGLVAREGLIQAERDLIYAARGFERFRREFLFDITQDFLDLLVLKQAVTNAESQVERLREVEARERALFDAGRTPRFQSALAEQSVRAALDSLNNRVEALRFALDRFKVRLGLPVEQPLQIVESQIDLAVPSVDVDQAVRLALLYRLDLQTQRDVVNDARRLLANARNDLLPDLDFSGSVSVPTDASRARAGVRFEPRDGAFSAALRFGVPLDRDIQRITVRQAQIELERQGREYDRLRDLVAANVRAAVRDIDRARYSLQIQEESIAINLERQESIESAPDRATPRDASEAANDLARSRDRRDTAYRDLQVAILRYLLESGQLRVDQTGMIIPPRGLEIPGDQPQP